MTILNRRNNKLEKRREAVTPQNSESRGSLVRKMCLETMAVSLWLPDGVRANVFLV